MIFARSRFEFGGYYSYERGRFYLLHIYDLPLNVFFIPVVNLSKRHLELQEKYKGTKYIVFDFLRSVKL